MGLTRGINLSLSSHLCLGSTLEVLAAGSDCSARVVWSLRKLGGIYQFFRWVGLLRRGADNTMQNGVLAVGDS